MDPILGQLILFPFSWAPRGWALCYGQLLPINENQALFSLIGTYFGGDGRTTFGLPDLRGRIPMGQGQGPGLQPYSIGQRGGFEMINMSVANLAAHFHQQDLSSATAQLLGNEEGPDSQVPKNCTLTKSETTELYSTEAPDETKNFHVGSIKITGGGNTLPTGNNQPLENRQPYLVMNWCIALEGIYPSRS
jgi:microcystin-dependent protein